MATRERMVVIGNGMVGLRLLERFKDKELLERTDVTVFGAEPRPALDRVNLTDFFYGSTADQLEIKSREWYEQNGIELFTGDPVVLVDREAKIVHSQQGRKVPYDRLVFATGSRAFRPEIPGGDLAGVFVYRNLHDLERIRDRARSCRNVAVIGGGLLGLEAAEAFKELGLRTHVIERGAGLLAKQLNPEGSGVLQRQIEAAGIFVHNAKITTEIEPRGDELVITFRDGTCMKVGMVVFAAGIRPRDELAKACGLELGPRGGIRIDETLTTSDPGIHALGECASHDGTIYGLVLPGYEMAEVLVDRLAGGQSEFTGADQSAILKLEGIEVAAVGQYQADCPSYTSNADGLYRRIYLRNGKLVGAIGIGDWPEQARVREAIKYRRRIWPWNINRFENRGWMWRPADIVDVSTWPDTAEICNCLSVCKGTLRAACASDCASVEQLAVKTGASTVCGSCRPLLAQIAGAPAPAAAPPVKAKPLLLISSLVATIAALIVLLLKVPFAPTVTGGWRWEALWLDLFIKQVTGFTIVGLAVLSMVLSLRKRIKKLSFGNFGYWRALHAALGVFTLLALVTHTGMHLGHNLNFVLMLNFLALAALGGLAGGITALERRLEGPAARWLQKVWTTAHIVLVWPLPVLIFFHAFASYYY
ncbi:MAG: FAD-dependent oxidoreductase [Limisphaerales bacterium]